MSFISKNKKIFIHLFSKIGWFLDKVVVYAGDGTTHYFHAGRWFATDEDDTQIVRELSVSKDDKVCAFFPFLDRLVIESYLVLGELLARSVVQDYRQDCRCAWRWHQCQRLHAGNVSNNL